jgi:hypothetical protein
LRRKVVVITTLCLLIGAAAAYAAGDNVYTGTSMTFAKGVGTSKKPIGITFKQALQATNVDSSKAAAVLINIKTRIYGLKNDSKDFPSCTAAQITTRKADAFCPKQSKAAAGLVNALIGDSTLSQSSRLHCNPNLDVFNGGGNKLVFFFTTHSATQCAGLTTGSTAPYVGTISYQGKYQVTNIPLPPDVSTKVAGHANLYGSLVHEQLSWFKYSKTVKGKKVYSLSSIGCLHGKRPWSVTFTATTNGSDRQTGTVTGSSKC